MDPIAWSLTTPDGTELGRLDFVEGEMFRTSCRFRPTPAFDRVAPLFAAELGLLNREEMDAWEAAYARIADLGLELRPVGGGVPIREFILHVDGDEAWFRD
jgi:hypothetical protein